MTKKPVCRGCGFGTCCRHGVELDVFEVARILKKKLDIPKPWFEFLRRDSRMPSGFLFTTTVRNRRCVFQEKTGTCLVYDARPRYCREFPLEGGKKAPYYHHLCYHAK
ncbi:MAG: YkgJ family cysteine cluster protein [Candidatus Omnitrophota bacterium]